MKRRDSTAVAACRSALAAVDNAEAVDLSEASQTQPGVIAGGVTGLGAGDVARRALAEHRVVEILLAQVAGWQASAADYERSGHHDEAKRLRAEAELLSEVLADGDSQR